MRRPLLLRDGSSWQFRYGCRTATRTFWQFLVDDFRANEMFVFKVLGITREQRKRQENLITPKDEELVFTPEELEERRKQKVSELKTLRTINKGLAMELLVATMLSCLDSPQAVRPWCAVSAKGHPKMSAGPGFEDILATYGGFSIVAEVSAKRDASTDTDFFRRQLEQALDHADQAAGRQRDGATGIVYALVINKCSADTNHRIEKEYREVLLKYLNKGQVSSKKPDHVGVSGIRLIPLRSWDFFDVMDRLQAESSDSGLSIRSEVLAAALEEVYMLLHRRNTAIEEPLIAKTFARALRKKAPAGAQLVLDTIDDA